MDISTYALAKKYVKDTMAGAGAIKGQDGASAYQIAVENGYSGTVTQWLASLKGEKGDTADAEILANISGYNPVLLWSGFASGGGTMYSAQQLSTFSQFICKVASCYCIGINKGSAITLYGTYTGSNYISLYSSNISLGDDNHTITVNSCKSIGLYSSAYTGSLSNLGISEIYGIVGVDQAAESLNGQTKTAVAQMKTLLGNVSTLLRNGDTTGAANAIDNYLA